LVNKGAFQHFCGQFIHSMWLGSCDVRAHLV
jgi:hypothetical protein